MLNNAKIISFFTVISRILGYIRDFFIAKYFGTSVYSDIFFTVFRMPNSLRRFLGEGAVNSAVVPVLSKIDEKDKPKAVWNIIFVFTILLFAVAIIGVVFSKELIAVFAAGFLHSDKLIIINTMTKITFPYIFFIGLSVLLMGILNTHNHFTIPAFAPALLNISIITSIFLFFSKFSHPVYSLCIGVIIGGILQLFISFIDFLRLNIPFVFSFRLEKSTKEILKLMSITALGGGIFQLSSMVDTFMASFMPHGSFSYLFYANRLFQLPFAVFTIALTQSSLVDLSIIKKEEIIKKTKEVIKLVSLISVSTTLFFLFFGRDVVDLLFKHGKFNETSLNNTNLALSIMILSFFFFSQTKILSNLFYALKDAKTPLKASGIAAVFSVVLSVILGLLYGFSGLAVALSVSGVVNMLFLVYFVNKKIGGLKFNMFMDLDVVLLFFTLLSVSLILKQLNLYYLLDLTVSSILYASFSYIFYKRLHLE